ncbi:TetR/AcrR family transcriptional regulator [Pengzhenrongella phosphoraccumulans]|uniref:TetR/AcrR family transcriptional regulator n=1 Tax=Pengzhenrongella phosphoraccumulans TaxID=3114394 RepID=UPI00388DD70B
MSTGTPTPRSRGPRPAGEDTRAAILVAAQVEFAESGFDATSVRAVARRAGVDPALVRHYFGSKSDLFVALNGLPERPGQILGALFDAGTDGVGRRMVALFFTLWDTPRGGSACVPSSQRRRPASRWARGWRSSSPRR